MKTAASNVKFVCKFKYDPNINPLQTKKNDKYKIIYFTSFNFSIFDYDDYDYDPCTI